MVFSGSGGFGPKRLQVFDGRRPVSEGSEPPAVFRGLVDVLEPIISCPPQSPLHSVDLSEGEGSTRSSVEARCRGQVVVEGLGNAC